MILEYIYIDVIILYFMEKSVKDLLNPVIEEPDELIKEVKVQDTGRQLILPLPALFSNILKIKRGSIFILKASIKNKGEYSIKLK